MNFERTRIGILPTLALTALTVVTVVSCGRVFAGWDFLPMMLTLALAVHVTLAAARALRIHLLIATPLAMLVAVAVIGRGMYHDTIRLLVLPTRDTWHLASIDLKDAWHQFPTAVAPVPAANGFLLVAALAVAVVAYTADTFGFRAYGRVEAVIPSGVVFTFVSALGVEGNDRARIWSGAAWLLAACLSVALLRSAHNDLGNTWLGGRRRERTIRIAIAATAVSLVTVATAYAVAPHLPGAGETALINPDGKDADGGEVQAISPIVDIKARLVNRSNRVMFQVESEREAYWHLTSLSGFDGEKWTYDESFSKADGKLDVEPLAGGDQIEQTFTIQQMGDAWVPAAYEAIAIDGGASKFVYNAATGTIRVAGDGKLTAGLTYTVTSTLPTFTPSELRASSSSSPPDEKYLGLPDNFPSSLVDIARSITEGASTSYDQALALQNWFRDNFKYDQNVPRGNGEQAIQTFLNQRRGYCEQFAGTFAALGRSIGLPTRVAIGFTPGVVENGKFVVRGRNAHAWPEVWFDDLGWVLFEPTPGRGAPGAADYTGVAPAQDTGTGEDTSTNEGPAEDSVPPTTRPRTSTTVTVPDPDNGEVFPGVPDPSGGITPPTGGSVSAGWLVVLGVLAVAVAWFVLLPLAATAWRRRRRGPTPADHVTAAWSDAALALSLVGVARRPGETPIEHAQRAWKTTGIDGRTLQSLASAATKAVYAAGAVSPDTADECDHWRHEVARRARDRATWRTRLRARIDPRIAGALR